VLLLLLPVLILLWQLQQILILSLIEVLLVLKLWCGILKAKVLLVAGQVRSYQQYQKD
jgi:hypothetical protein